MANDKKWYNYFLTVEGSSTEDAQLKSLRYASSRPTGQTTIHVDTNADNPQIANADLVMALAMATWRMKSPYPTATPTPPACLPGF